MTLRSPIHTKPSEEETTPPVQDIWQWCLVQTWATGFISVLSSESLCINFAIKAAWEFTKSSLYYREELSTDSRGIANLIYRKWICQREVRSGDAEMLAIEDSEERPSFTDLSSIMDTMLSSASDYAELNMKLPHNSQFNTP